MVLQPEVLMEDMQRIEVLAFIFMQPLDLYIKDRIGVQSDPGGIQHMFGQPLFVFELDGGELLGIHGRFGGSRRLTLGLGAIVKLLHEFVALENGLLEIV